ncbi:MAG TPA: M23 family metallopeptidase [Pyrinomonadaceae bacterium]
MRPWLALVTVVVCLAVVSVWVLHRRRGGQIAFRTPPLQALPSPSAENVIAPSPTPSLSSSPILSQAPSAEASVTSTPQTPSPSPESFVGVLNLIVPVAGVRREQLIDTFSEARSEGRTHDAIDIPAPAGTQVLAAADGEVVRLFQSERGGTTIYQISADRKLVFYYAHLQGYAANLHEGQYVHQGDVIAYVGDTGNAGLGNFHLHFSIAILNDPKRYWEGTNINPYPLLHR